MLSDLVIPGERPHFVLSGVESIFTLLKKCHNVSGRDNQGTLGWRSIKGMEGSCLGQGGRLRPVSVSCVFLFMYPVQSQGPLLVSKEVADEVAVAAVNQNTDTIGQHLGDLVLVVLHPIATELTCQSVMALSGTV